jgi:hypothetical protein
MVRGRLVPTMHEVFRLTTKRSLMPFQFIRASLKTANRKLELLRNQNEVTKMLMEFLGKK